MHLFLLKGVGVWIVGLLDDVIAEREQFISIKDILLNISFNKNEPLHDVAYYLSVMYDSIEGLDIYHFDGFNFSKDEQASNHFELLLYKALDGITIGSGRNWVYSGKYSSFGDYWGDGEGLLKILNSYPYSYFKKADINNNEMLSRLVSFDTKTPTEQLADAHAQIADLKSKLAQAHAALADVPTEADTLQGIAKYNADKAYIISTSQALAKYIWSMDTQKAIRTGDMVQQIRHVMHNVAPNLLPDDKAIRGWLSGIAPCHAKKSGKTPKNDPNEIPLIMKK